MDGYTVVLIVMLLVFFASFCVIVIARYQGSPVNLRSPEALALALSAYFAFSLVTPGSENSMQFGPVKVTTKTPSGVAKIVGKKEGSFKAENTAMIESGKILIFASSPVKEPTLKFIEGEDYVEDLGKSDDGNTRYYSATIPPGKMMSGVTPEQVTFNAVPWPKKWRLTASREPESSEVGIQAVGEKLKALEEELKALEGEMTAVMSNDTKKDQQPPKK